MPSVKWAIAIGKKNTATAKRRVFYFEYFPVSCPKTDAGFELSGARLPPNRRPLLGRKRGCGGSVFPLRGCTTGARGCPLEGLAGVESAFAGTCPTLLGGSARRYSWIPTGT